MKHGGSQQIVGGQVNPLGFEWNREGQASTQLPKLRRLYHSTFSMKGNFQEHSYFICSDGPEKLVTH